MSIIKRRKFLVGLVLSLFFHRFSNQSVSAQESQSVNIQWRVPAEQVNTVREELNFEGQVIPDKSTITDDRGLPLIYILIGAVALGQIATTLLEIYKDTKYGGVIVRKNKKGELLIENNANLERGTIIIDQGNEVKIIFREKNDPTATELIQALTPLIK
ncbi:MAG: hypothetical protein ACKPJT_11200 [Microcystis panniformis]